MNEYFIEIFESNKQYSSQAGVNWNRTPYRVSRGLQSKGRPMDNSSSGSVVHFSTSSALAGLAPKNDESYGKYRQVSSGSIRSRTRKNQGKGRSNLKSIFWHDFRITVLLTTLLVVIAFLGEGLRILL